MLLIHRLGPSTEIPDGTEWPSELAGMLMKTPEPVGAWGFVAKEDPRDSVLFSTSTYFCNSENFTHHGKWRPAVFAYSETSDSPRTGALVSALRALFRRIVDALAKAPRSRPFCR